MKLSKQMKSLAAQCVADVVREAAGSTKPPSAKELKALAEGSAKAVIAGFKRISAAS
jgi:hypothetical protein